MSPISPCHSPPPDIPSTSQSGHLITKWLTSGLGAILLMGAHWLHKLPAISSNTQDFWFVISVITFLVLLYSAGHYFRGAWLAFKNHQANMNTLIALGVGAAWIYSTIVILFPDSVPASARYAYFDSALFVVSFVSLGALLEARASHNTSLALTKLLSLQADTARVIENNQTIERPIDEVKVGDYIRVKPGEKIPLDGIVCRRHTCHPRQFVNQSHSYHQRLYPCTHRKACTDCPNQQITDWTVGRSHCRCLCAPCGDISDHHLSGMD